MNIYTFIIVLVMGFFLPAHANLYQDTVKQVKKIYSRSSHHTHVDFLNLDIVKSSAKFKEFIQQLADNKDDILYNISGYYHPVGFIKIVLHKGDKGEQLRFHFWGAGGENAIQQEFKDGWEPIHNHRWNFSSKVICGGLTMNEFFDADSRIRFNCLQDAMEECRELGDLYNIYDVCMVPTRKNTNDDYKIIKTGKYAIVGNPSTRHIEAGGSYYLDHRIPHQVKPDFLTSTLLLIDPPSKRIASDIFITNSDVFADEFELQGLTQEETQKHLKVFLESMDKDK